MSCFSVVQSLRTVTAEVNISSQRGLFLKSCLFQGDQRRLMDDDTVILLTVKNALIHSLSHPTCFSHIHLADVCTWESLELKGGLPTLHEDINLALKTVSLTRKIKGIYPDALKILLLFWDRIILWFFSRGWPWMAVSPMALDSACWFAQGQVQTIYLWQRPINLLSVLKYHHRLPSPRKHNNTWSLCFPILRPCVCWHN